MIIQSNIFDKYCIRILFDYRRKDLYYEARNILNSIGIFKVIRNKYGLKCLELLSKSQIDELRELLQKSEYEYSLRIESE